jgi:MFS family permease
LRPVIQKLTSVPKKSWVKRTAAIILAAVVTFLLLWLRLPGQFFNPQFWAEDSTVFWLDQYQHGLKSFFILQAGTLATAQRLIAFVSSFFNPALAPRAFVLGAIMFMLWGAASVAASISKPLMGFLLGATLAAIPYAGDEILGNAANIQWPLAPVLALLLVSGREHGRALSINNGILAAIAATTGPFSIVLAPVALARFAYRRDVISVIVMLAAVVQLLALTSNYPTPASPDNGSFLHLIDIMIQRGMPATSISVLAGGALVAVALSVEEGQWFRRGLIWAGFGFLAAAAFKFRNNVHVFDYANWSPRYFYPFQVCIWWCAISLLFVQQARLAGAMWLAYSVAAYPADFFQRSPLNDVKWSDEIRGLGITPLEFPVNPQGWKIEIPPRP